MIIKIDIEINTLTGYCSVTELNAETVKAQLDTSSMESIAHSAGEALSDYIEGLN